MVNTDYLMFLDKLLRIPIGEDYIIQKENENYAILHLNILFSKEAFFNAIDHNISSIDNAIEKINKKKDFNNQKINLI